MHRTTDALYIVPAAGKGTRLGRLTEKRAKPAVAVSFDPLTGDITRMIDIPLGAIQQAGGSAIVTTHFAVDTLAFVKTYDNVTVVDDGGYITPLDSASRNRAIIEKSNASIIGIVPADYDIRTETLLALQTALRATNAAAVIMGTRYVEGHLHVRPVDRHGFVMPVGAKPHGYIADLGVHVIDKEWFTKRLKYCETGLDSIDIWDDFYRIHNPLAPILIFVPEEDRPWIDMGRPHLLRDTMYRLNGAQADAYGNIRFPGATLMPRSSNTIALPGSAGLSVFNDAIIPEGAIARYHSEILQVHTPAITT